MSHQLDAQIFNTFHSNESNILESLKMIQNNQNELNQIINEVEGRIFERGEVMLRPGEVRGKKKTSKSQLEAFLEEQNELASDQEMLQDEHKAAPLERRPAGAKVSSGWKELVSVWNQYQFLVVLREYRCEYCQKIFSKKTALGGHTSKHHPNKSTDYQYRQRSLKNRQIERERQKFYKTLRTSDFI